MANDEYSAKHTKLGRSYDWKEIRLEGCSGAAEELGFQADWDTGCILGVHAGSFAEQGGLQYGMCIVAVNDQQISNPTLSDYPGCKGKLDEASKADTYTLTLSAPLADYNENLGLYELLEPLTWYSAPSSTFFYFKRKLKLEKGTVVNIVELTAESKEQCGNPYQFAKMTYPYGWLAVWPCKSSDRKSVKKIQGGSTEVTTKQQEHIRQEAANKLAMEQQNIVLSTFKQFDVDGDGTISLDELDAVLKKIDPANWTSEKTKVLWSMIDVDADGVLDVKELTNFLFHGKSSQSSIDTCGLSVGDVVTYVGENDRFNGKTLETGTDGVIKEVRENERLRVRFPGIGTVTLTSQLLSSREEIGDNFIELVDPDNKLQETAE